MVIWYANNLFTLQGLPNLTNPGHLQGLPNLTNPGHLQGLLNLTNPGHFNNDISLTSKKHQFSIIFFSGDLGGHFDSFPAGKNSLLHLDI
jgi:hypothetical protein